MTQAEVEIIAREIRTRCLRSSWSELVGFWQGVMGNLEEAYRAVVRSTASLDRIPLADLSDMQTIARDKLAMALRQMAGERQAAKWDAEATRE